MRSPPKYEGAFELCLRHLHGRRTPLDVECTVGALLSNRAAHALKLPGRWVPTPDGVVEDYAAQSARPEEGALVATSDEKEPSSLDVLASIPPETGVSCTIPGTSFAPSSDLLALATPEPFAEEDDDEKDSLCMCDVSLEEEEEKDDEKEEELPNCAVDREEDGSASICTEDAGDDRLTNSYSEEGGATSQVVEPSHAEEDSCTEGTSPALEGGTPRSGASAADQRPATYRRRRGGRQWHRAQVAHTAWWNEDAWRHSSEPRYPRGSQWRRTAARAWRPKD